MSTNIPIQESLHFTNIKDLSQEASYDSNSLQIGFVLGLINVYHCVCDDLFASSCIAEE